MCCAWVMSALAYPTYPNNIIVMQELRTKAVGFGFQDCRRTEEARVDLRLGLICMQVWSVIRWVE